ncbi:MAG TPA: phage tail assembly protein [Roseiflexaceae bacterium]|nr:phage tail assembly protein [Roseiflexaceae bacterium]
MTFQTEFEFTLPRGYVDREGNIHRQGTMRLATALDEIAPMRDPRVRSNQAYLVIILLARVITRLGDLRDSEINPGVIESLFSADLAYLQDFYRRINETGTSTVEVVCPDCSSRFEVDIGRLGG